MSSHNEKIREYRLIDEILEGDHDAYRHLVDRYSGMVFHVVRSFEKDEEEVRELSQQIFVKAFERLGSFNRQSTYSSWLYSLASNHCRDYVKNIRRLNTRFSDYEAGYMEDRMPDEEDPHYHLEKKELKHQLAHAIGQLADNYSEPLLMKYRDGYSYDVISEKLGISVGALKVRVHRARQELKEALEKDHRR